SSAKPRQILRCAQDDGFRIARIGRPGNNPQPYKNFSRLWRLINAQSKLTAEATARMSRFCLTMAIQIVSDICPGFRNGFKKIFHRLEESGSENRKKNNPTTITITAAAAPLRVMVEKRKPKQAKSPTGNVRWYTIFNTGI